MDAEIKPKQHRSVEEIQDDLSQAEHDVWSAEADLEEAQEALEALQTELAEAGEEAGS